MNRLPETIGWDNWGALMQDAELFAPAVRAIAVRCGFSAREIRAGFPGTHAVFVADQTYVVKLYAPLPLPDAFCERICYRAIARARVPFTPGLIREGTLCWEGRNWPYIAITYLPGRAVRELWPSMDGPDRLRASEALASWSRAYRAIADPFPPRHPLGAEGWLGSIQQKLDRTLGLIAQMGLPERLISELRRFAESIMPALRAWPVVLTHSDLTADHLLIDGDRMSVIDFADSRMAFECVEWTPLWFDLMKRDRAAFLRFLARCGRTWARETRDEMLMGVLLHGFGAQTLAEAGAAQCLGELMEALPALEDEV